MRKFRPALPAGPEPPVVIQNSRDGPCIQVDLNTGDLLLSGCNQNSLAQQWKWNEHNQLYNPVTLKCISTGVDGSLELHSCSSGDALQQWLCANHFIEQPSTGNCITVSGHSLIAEECTMENKRQLWNKYNNSLQSEIEDTFLHLLGDDSQALELEKSICTIPGYHTFDECYDEKVRFGWSVCQRLGYFVSGVYHLGYISHVITDLRCCFTPHIFIGQPETLSTIEQEVCVNMTWWSSSNANGWFKCPAGMYFKGYLKGVQIGWQAVQKVRCCRTVQAPSLYRQCYTDSSDGSEGIHECSRAGYHIAGIYKTDCSLIECVEKLLCCI